MAAPDRSLHIRRTERRDFRWSRLTLLHRSRLVPEKVIQMTLRHRLLKLGSPARVAVIAVSICVCALSPDAYAENPNVIPVALRDSPPIQRSAAPPATFFTIDSRTGAGAGCNSSRLAKVLEYGNRCTACAGGNSRCGPGTVWTVPVPRSRRFTLAQMAGRRSRFDQRRKGSGAMQGRRRQLPFVCRSISAADQRSQVKVRPRSAR
jgi:hypothetical protein